LQALATARTEVAGFLFTFPHPIGGIILGQHPKQKHIYVGVDLPKNKHVAVIINYFHDKLHAIAFDNKPSGFDELIQVGKKHRKWRIAPIFGLEDSGGYGRALAVYLVEHNHIVKDVNPSLSASERRNNPMAKKHDEWDAERVANVLLNKLDSLPNANPQDVYWTIKQLINRRSALVREGAKLKQQLHIQVNQNYPSYKEFFSEIDLKSALAFWEKYPSPDLLLATPTSPNTTSNTPDGTANQNTSQPPSLRHYCEQTAITYPHYQRQRKLLSLSKLTACRCDRIRNSATF
jgi:hypothetical protein